MKLSRLIASTALVAYAANAFGAQQVIDNSVGTPDSMSAGAVKINSNFSELYGHDPIVDNGDGTCTFTPPDALNALTFGCDNGTKLVENAGALSGAAPAGAALGIDTTTGAIYHVNAGNWAAIGTDSIPEGGVNEYFTEPRVLATATGGHPGDILTDGATVAQAYDELELAIEASADVHSDIDLTTTAPADGDILEYDFANSTFVPVAPTVVGVPGIDDVLQQAQALTTSRTINQNNFGLTFSNSGNFFVTGTGPVSFFGSTYGVVADGLLSLTTQNGNDISLNANGDFLLNAATGVYDFTTQPPAKTTQVTESLVIDTATGQWYLELDGNPRVFADDTTVSPGIVGAPSAAEIQTFAGGAGVTDATVYYTGTNVGTDPITYVFDIDNAGTATLIQAPASQLNGIDDVLALNQTFTDNRSINRAGFNYVSTGTGSHTIFSGNGALVNTSFSLTPTLSQLSYADLGGGTQASITADANGIAISAVSGGDLRINGATGVAGDCILSGGDNVGPSWGECVTIEDLLTSNDATAALSANQGRILAVEQDALQTLSGLTAGATDLGFFSGSLIANGESVKDAFQALEVAIEDRDLDQLIQIGGTITGASVGDIIYYDGADPQVGLRQNQTFMADTSTGTWDPRLTDSIYVNAGIADVTMLEPSPVSPDTGRTVSVVIRNASANVRTITLPAAVTHEVNGAFGTTTLSLPAGSAYNYDVRLDPAGSVWVWSGSNASSTAVDNTTLATIVGGGGGSTTLLNTTAWNDLPAYDLTIATPGTYLVNTTFTIFAQQNGTAATGSFLAQLTLDGTAVNGSSKRVLRTSDANTEAFSDVVITKVVTTTTANQVVRVQYRQDNNNAINPVSLIRFLGDDDGFIEAVRLN